MLLSGDGGFVGLLNIRQGYPRKVVGKWPVRFSVFVFQGCNGIAAWKHYVFSSWQDSGENKELQRVTYNKTRNDTILRVAFHTTLAQNRHGGCGEWYVKFSGNECTQPAPITTSVYTDHGNRIGSWMTIPAELSGFCNGTSSSSISTGPVVISVHVRNCHSSSFSTAVFTGERINGKAKVTSYFLVEEYCR